MDVLGEVGVLWTFLWTFLFMQVGIINFLQVRTEEALKKIS